MRVSQIARRSRVWLFRLREKMGSQFYTHIQNYSFVYLLKLKNLSSQKTTIGVILPLPPTTNYQKIKGRPRLRPKEKRQACDKRFGNQYALWEIVLNPYDSEILRQEFAAEVFPRETKWDKRFFLRDYQEIKDNLDYQLYLQTNKFLAANKKLRNLARKIIDREKNLHRITRKLYCYVRDTLQYGNPIAGLYSSLESLKRKRVDCGGFCSLLGAFYILLGIPARIVSGFWAGYKINRMHVWLEFLLPNGNWVPVDPTSEHLFLRGRSYKSGRFGFIGSDRIVFSFGSEIPIGVGNQKRVVDILQNPIVIPRERKDFVKIETRLVSKQ